MPSAGSKKHTPIVGVKSYTLSSFAGFVDPTHAPQLTGDLTKRTDDEIAGANATLEALNEYVTRHVAMFAPTLPTILNPAILPHITLGLLKGFQEIRTLAFSGVVNNRRITCSDIVPSIAVRDFLYTAERILLPYLDSQSGRFMPYVITGSAFPIGFVCILGSMAWVMSGCKIRPATSVTPIANPVLPPAIQQTGAVSGGLLPSPETVMYEQQLASALNPSVWRRIVVRAATHDTVFSQCPVLWTHLDEAQKEEAVGRFGKLLDGRIISPVHLQNE